MGKKKIVEITDNPPMSLPCELKELPVSEDVSVDESPKDIPEVIIPQPKISTKMPTRPAGEFVKLKDKIEVQEPKPDFKAELIEKPAIQKEALTIPTAAKSGTHYARRNIELIKDINRVMTPQNPSNSENNGVFKLSKNRPDNHAGSTIHTGAHFQNKPGIKP